MISKPTVLHIGDAIKYNHDFYHTEFESRFNVIQATETDRDSFMNALRAKKSAQIPSMFSPSAVS